MQGDQAGAKLKDLDESMFFAVDIDGDGNISTGDEVVKIINNHDGTTDIKDGMLILTFNSTAKFYDIDDDGYDEGDEVILDVGGNGTYSAQPDTTIGGTPPDNGENINSTEPDAWKPSDYHEPGLYFYDANESDGAFNASKDAIWVDDGNVYYDQGKDTYIGGLDKENQGPGYNFRITGNPFKDVYFLDEGGATTVKHVSPGVWVIQTNCNDFNVYVTIYGQPIASGKRVIKLTFTAE